MALESSAWVKGESFLGLSRVLHEHPSPAHTSQPSHGDYNSPIRTSNSPVSVNARHSHSSPHSTGFTPQPPAVWCHLLMVWHQRWMCLGRQHPAVVEADSDLMMMGGVRCLAEFHVSTTFTTTTLTRRLVSHIDKAGET
jgi:hypothetical protein